MSLREFLGKCRVTPHRHRDNRDLSLQGHPFMLRRSATPDSPEVRFEDLNPVSGPRRAVVPDVARRAGKLSQTINCSALRLIPNGRPFVEKRSNPRWSHG